MSSQSRSQCCDAVTVKGRNCRNYAMKDSKWCFQHKKLSSNIIHTAPFVEFQPILFSQSEPSETTCQYRNKFGEFVCKHEKTCGKFCQEHFDIVNPFFETLRKLLDLITFYKENHFTIDSFFKLVTNICFYFLKHKDLIVQFGLGKMVESFIDVISFNIRTLSYGMFTTSLIIHYRSKPFNDIVRTLLNFRVMMMNIRYQVQIDKTRDTIVSNNIKINKLTEICLKQSETSSTILPVFSKGIDKHILSFIV